MTARTSRSFDAAFAGVFPGTPAELYARWTAQVTAEAIAAERVLTKAGLAEGTLVQRLRGATGDPAVSPDGGRVALVVRTAGRASRIVVWRTGAEPRDTTRLRVARRQADTRRRLDPEDVPAVPYLPAPKRALATLRSRDGVAFANPRWLPDGRRLLVERDESLPDGRVRPDLWLWDTRGGVRRVTRGAAVHDADPSPDGRDALATRCTAGWCDLVRVDLATGDVTTLAAGSPSRTYARPRWSPDGGRVAVVTQDDARWHVLVGAVDASRSPIATWQPVGPDDGASRYDPTFVRDGRSLLVTSDRGGVPNVERIDLASGQAFTLTRVTGAAFAPEPIGGRALYFLSLRSSGFDLRQVSLDTIGAVAPLALIGRPAGDSGTATGATPLAPRIAVGGGATAAAGAVAQRVAGTAPDTFPVVPPGRTRRYGLGSPRLSLLPGGAWTADGNSVLGIVTGADPVGRLSWVLVGAAGAPATWRGGAISAAYRGLHDLPVALDVQAFGVTQRSAPTGDLRYRAGVVALSPRVVLGSTTLAARVGASSGRLVSTSDRAAPRTIGFGEVRAGAVRGWGDQIGSVSAAFTGASGRSADSAFTRWLASAGLAVRAPLVAARASYARGEITRGSAFERFLVGGPETALADASVLGQRIAMPALPTGALAGNRVETARVALSGMVVEPYAWAARAPDVSTRWLRVVGAEASFSTGPIPFARAPGLRAVGGVGYAVDGPTRRRVQAYVTMAVRP